MPSPTDETEVKTKFYELAHFPGVLGLVDGTHIRIQKPSENEADYVNRHFYHSIIVQAICQPDGGLVMFWHDFPGPFTILVCGSYRRLEFTLRIASHLGNIY